MKWLVAVLSLTYFCTVQAEEAAKPAEASQPPAAAETPKAAEAKNPPPGTYGTKGLFDNRWQFGLGVGVMLTDTSATYDDIKVHSGSSTISGSAELEYKRTGSLALEGRLTPQNSWGFILGLNVEGRRELKKAKFKVSGVTDTVVGGSGSSKVQFTTFYGNALYRWNQFYIPFGLNVSVVRFSPADDYDGSSEARGQIGGQLGIGYMFTEHMALEAFSWVTGMSLKSEESGTETDYGTGTFSSLVLFGKYAF